MPLNDFIYDDLRTRIEAGDATSDKLTLSALSQRYNVSLTPIRVAVDRLIDKRYLVKLGNGRLEVNVQAPRRRRTSAAKLTLEPPVNPETAIQAAVVALSLRGQLDYLREEAVAANFGVGRTVIRPILSRLAGKGLLQYVPRCGWRPRAFDAKDLSDFLVVREALELRALDLARVRLDDGALRKMLEDNRRRKRLATGALANSLHGYWIRLSDNKYVADFFERHGIYYETLFDFAAPGAEAIEEMAAQHCEILTALLARRWGEARRALANHIRDQRPIVERAMARLHAEIPGKAKKGGAMLA